MDRLYQSLLKYEVRSGEWRYRLTVRTDGSQPSNRGSIPRTATMTHISPLAHSPGRWPGLFISALLLATPAHAHADGSISLQSADGRRLVTAVESPAPITLDGALDEEVR